MGALKWELAETERWRNGGSGTHLPFLQLTGLPWQSEAVKVAVGFIPRLDITNDSVA
jgi:hypothetical protein